jgi:hypothetical protein
VCSYGVSSLEHRLFCLTLLTCILNNRLVGEQPHPLPTMTASQSPTKSWTTHFFGGSWLPPAGENPLHGHTETPRKALRHCRNPGGKEGDHEGEPLLTSEVLSLTFAPPCRHGHDRGALKDTRAAACFRTIVSLKIFAMPLQSNQNPHKRSISRSFRENDANCHSFSSCADILTIVKRALSQNEVAADSTL